MRKPKLSPEEKKRRNLVSTKKRYRTWHGRLGCLVNNAKSRARRRNIPFDIDTEFVRELLEKNDKKCAVTGVELVLDVPEDKDGDYRAARNAPSLDRIDPKGGYTRDNVRVVCWWYNMWKSTFTDQEVREMAELVAKL